MKKKLVKLSLNKQKISNLQQGNIVGGANTKQPQCLTQLAWCPSQKVDKFGCRSVAQTECGCVPISDNDCE